MSSRPGSVELTNVSISPISGEAAQGIKEIVSSIEIYESIYMAHLTAKLICNDSKGLIAKLPIVGMEVVNISYRTAYDNSGPANVTSLNFVVYGIEAITGTSESSTYIINLVSLDYVNNTKKLISKKFKGHGSSIVMSLLGDQGINTTRGSQISSSTNELTFVSNFWTPIECIKYCTLNSLDSSEGMSASFYFYESTKGYHFVTSSDLLSPPASPYEVNMLYNYNNDTGRREDTNGGSVLDETATYAKVLAMRSGTMFDFITQSMMGSMNVTNYEMNLLRKKITKTSYDYNRDFAKSMRLGEAPALAGSHLFPSTSTVASYPELWDKSEDVRSKVALTRNALLSQMNLVSYEIMVHGRSDMFAGRLIEFDFPTFGSKSDGGAITDPYRSGLYLVAAVCHTLTINSHKMTLQITKDGLK